MPGYFSGLGAIVFLGICIAAFDNNKIEIAISCMAACVILIGLVAANRRLARIERKLNETNRIGRDL